MGCPEIKHNNCESCCESTFKMVKKALYSKRVLEGGYETESLPFMSEFIKLIKFNENHENELRVVGKFEIGDINVDNTEVIKSIDDQTKLIQNVVVPNQDSLESAIYFLKDALTTLQDVMYMELGTINNTIKNQVKSYCNYQIHELQAGETITVTIPANTFKVTAKLYSGAGTITLGNGMPFDFNAELDNSYFEIYNADAAVHSNQINLTAVSDIKIGIECLSLRDEPIPYSIGDE